MSLPVFLRSLHSIGLPWHGLIRYPVGGTPTITRDLDSGTTTLTTSLTVPDGDAWRLKKTGIAAASTPAAIAALGGEYRNEALMPVATGGKIAFFDEGGTPWSIASASVAVSSGDVVISVQVRPFGRLGDGVDYSSTATVSATVSGLTGLDTDGAMILASINETGRRQIWKLPENVLIKGLSPAMMHGMVEVVISGTGAWTTWPGTLSGLSVTATVLKTDAECGWAITSSTDTGDADNCHEEVTHSRLIHAWYDATGAIVYLTASKSQEDTQSRSETDLGGGSRTWTFDSTFTLSQSVTDGTNAIDAAEYKVTIDLDGSNAGGVGSETEIKSYYIDGDLVAQHTTTRSVTSDTDWGGAPPVICQAQAIAAGDPNFTLFAYSGATTIEDGTTTSDTTVSLYAAQRIRMITNNLIGVMQAVGELDETATAAQWDGFIHPAGTVAGYSDDASLSTQTISGTTYLVLNPASPYGAYNPYNDDVVVGQSDRVGYV